MNDELQHYGILGMKWGIRRYQNKDGTWTEAGKKRYNSGDTENKQIKKTNNSKRSTSKSSENSSEQDASRKRANEYVQMYYAMRIHRLLRDKRNLEKQEREVNRRIRSAEYGTATGRTSADDVRAAKRAKRDWERAVRDNKRQINYQMMLYSLNSNG